MYYQCERISAILEYIIFTCHSFRSAPLEGERQTIDKEKKKEKKKQHRKLKKEEEEGEEEEEAGGGEWEKVKGGAPLVKVSAS